MAQARSIEELWELMDTVFAAGHQAHEEFSPRPSDVIISPFAKCGTTWLQQLTHGLRTCGDMDFDDIGEVVPWITTAPHLGQDLDAGQGAEPRLFKSHAAWHDVPKGCRYIVSFRDPADAAVSFAHFMDGWLLEPGAVGLEELVSAWMLEDRREDDYWGHTTSWLGRPDDPDVLLLTFNEMKRNLPGVARRIAAFLDLPLDDGRVEVATEQASFEFMSRHAEPFGEPLFRAWAHEHAGLPLDSDAGKVRQGSVDRNREQLSQATRRQLQERWTETIGAATGLADYDDLVVALRPHQPL